MAAGKMPSSIYELKLTLLGIDPLIWRRLQVPSDINLSRLKDAFQIVMGWTDSHLHQFEKGGQYWGMPDDDAFEGDIEIIDESGVPLRDLLDREGDTMVYVYDFGDNWQHEVRLEMIVPSDVGTRPVCLGGERRCPPEDVGGPHGYQEFLQVIFEPDHEDFERYRHWAGDPIHAEAFDLKAVNRRLARMKWPVRHRR